MFSSVLHRGASHSGGEEREDTFAAAAQVTRISEPERLARGDSPPSGDRYKDYRSVIGDYWKWVQESAAHKLTGNCQPSIVHQPDAC